MDEQRIADPEMDRHGATEITGQQDRTEDRGAREKISGFFRGGHEQRFGLQLVEMFTDMVGLGR
jgi:hypothetical protein